MSGEPRLDRIVRAIWDELRRQGDEDYGPFYRREDVGRPLKHVTIDGTINLGSIAEAAMRAADAADA